LKIKNSPWSVNGGVVAAERVQCGATVEAHQRKDWWQRRGRTVTPKRKSGGRERIEGLMAAKRKEIY